MLVVADGEVGPENMVSPESELPVMEPVETLEVEAMPSGFVVELLESFGFLLLEAGSPGFPVVLL